MSSDWLDRAALRAEEPLSRGGVLKLAGASLLALGPIGVLFRPQSAAAAPASETDCLYCTWNRNAKDAEDRKACAKVMGVNVFAGVGCVVGTFFDPLNSYYDCRSACDAPPPKAPWTPPKEPAGPTRPEKNRPRPKPVERTKPTSKKEQKQAADDYCAICTSPAVKGYCLPCPSSGNGVPYLCCALPPARSDPNPCCPKN